MPQFNERLRLLRTSRGLSQSDLAKFLGISKSSVNMYERGEREPGLETLEAIGDFFNVDMDYLHGKSDIENRYRIDNEPSTSDNIEIGRRIETRRLELKLTMDDVALKMGIAKSTVQRYEKGKIGKIKLPVIESFAIALNVNPGWLIGKSDIIDRSITDASIPLPCDDNVFPRLLKTYRELNTDGRQKVYERATELAELPKYQLTPTTDEAPHSAHSSEAILQRYREQGFPVSDGLHHESANFSRVASPIILPNSEDIDDKK